MLYRQKSPNPPICHRRAEPVPGWVLWVTSRVQGLAHRRVQLSTSDPFLILTVLLAVPVQNLPLALVLPARSPSPAVLCLPSHVCQLRCPSAQLSSLPTLLCDPPGPPDLTGVHQHHSHLFRRRKEKRWHRAQPPALLHSWMAGFQSVVQRNAFKQFQVEQSRSLL